MSNYVTKMSFRGRQKYRFKDITINIKIDIGDQYAKRATIIIIELLGVFVSRYPLVKSESYTRIVCQG